MPRAHLGELVVQRAFAQTRQQRRQPVDDPGLAAIQERQSLAQVVDRHRLVVEGAGAGAWRAVDRLDRPDEHAAPLDFVASDLLAEQPERAIAARLDELHRDTGTGPLCFEQLVERREQLLRTDGLNIGRIQFFGIAHRRRHFDPLVPRSGRRGHDVTGFHGALLSGSGAEDALRCTGLAVRAGPMGIMIPPGFIKVKRVLLQLYCNNFSSRPGCRMDLTLAQTFLEIVQTRSFLRAAEQLHVTPTSVSARVRTLEELLGRALFVRNKSGATLTAAGEQFLPHATSLVQVWE